MKKNLLALSGTLLFSALLSAASLNQNRENLSLILYSSNIALAHETKELRLYKEEKSILYEGVPKTIQSHTINLTLPEGIEIESQQFRYDSLTQERLLSVHLGKKVQLRRLKSAYEYEIISATLLGYNQSESIVETIGHQILSVENSSIVFDAIPKELALHPSIEWRINAHKDIQTEIELEYIINGISFENHYGVYFDEKSAELFGWVSIDNTTQESFEDINLSTMTRADSTPEIKSGSFEDYYLYEIPFKVSLRANEQKQIQTLHQKNIPTQRVYIAQMSNPLYLTAEQKSEALSYLKLDGVESVLGKGIVRAYSKKRAKSLFLGESKIAHTPKNQALEILLGTNFDLTATQTSIKHHVTKESIASEVLYTLKNSSKEAKELTLLVPFTNESESKVETQRDYSYTKGNFVTFKIHLAAEATEKFSVRYESKK